MSNILKFACKAPNCGRRFTTQEGLNTHFNLRHPQLCKNNNNEIKQKEKDEKEKLKENEKVNEKTSMEKIIKQISSTKLNPHEKHHHLLQPIDHKGLSSSLLNNVKRKSQTINLYKDLKEKKDNKELDIYNSHNSEINTNNKEKNNKNKENIKINKNEDNISKDNKKKEIKKDIENEEIEEVEIPNIIEEKQKKLLNNLFGQINSLEKYLEKDCEFHKQFTLPQVPDYDKMYDSDEEMTEKKENKKVKEKENEIKNIKEDKKIFLKNLKYTHIKK